MTGDPLAQALRETTRARRAASRCAPTSTTRSRRFYAGGAARGGSGVIVLPCGAGKTVVGLGAMDMVQRHTLILCTNTTAVRQWISEILDKTDLTADRSASTPASRKRSARSPSPPTRS